MTHASMPFKHIWRELKLTHQSKQQTVNTGTEKQMKQTNQQTNKQTNKQRTKKNSTSNF